MYIQLMLYNSAVVVVDTKHSGRLSLTFRMKHDFILNDTLRCDSIRRRAMEAVRMIFYLLVAFVELSAIPSHTDVSVAMGVKTAKHHHIFIYPVFVVVMV